MKKKVALVTGGLSSEAQISYKSAQTVMSALDKNKYDVYLIDIHPTGWWYENIVGEEVAVFIWLSGFDTRAVYAISSSAV